MASRVSGRLAERFHPELAGARVTAPTGRAVLREMRDRLAGRRGWTQIMDRNAWFQRVAAREVARAPEAEGTVFAYSYAAAGILEAAKARGWRTVLGQMDPGPVEARLVEGLYRQAGQAGAHEAIPAVYWEGWRRETELADVIVVNSDWSRRALVEEGVAAEKIEIIPLAYEPTLAPAPWDAPAAFTPGRPLRLLFLGQVTLRKGIDLVLDAIAHLPGLPLRLDVVGPMQIDVPKAAADDPRIAFHGAIPRSAVGGFYAQADLFLFPTRSDGFGLTQLEALSAGVPVIASENCGTAVEDGINGRILRDLDAETLAAELEALVARPDRLAAWRGAARLDPRFGLDALGARLAEIGDRLHAA